MVALWSRLGAAALRALGLPFLVVCSLWLAGCATPAVPANRPAPQANHWSGRLGVRIDSQPPQSFTAAFELQGDAGSGSLRLFSPLGNTMAELVWDPQGAELRRDGRSEQGASIQDLLWQVSGTEIPLAALFEWLNQRPAIAPGWVTDTNGMTQGQLLLRRTDPLPAVQLHIRLEQ